MPANKLPNGYSRVTRHTPDVILDASGKVAGFMTDTDDQFIASVETNPLTGGNNIVAGTSTLKLPPGESSLSGGGGLTTGRSITASGNAQLSDGGTIIQANSASAVAVTIPNDSTIAWALDTVIAIYQIGAGVVSFAAGGGVTLRTPSSYAASVQYDTIFVRKVGANEWVVSK